MPTWRQYGETKRQGAQDQAYADVNRDSNMYLTALSKAAYGQAGNEYAGGLGDITNFLARSGPLADSGAKLALQKRLYSQIYGQARNLIGTSYADYLRQALQAQRNHRYQIALMELQKQQNSTGLGGFLGGVAGAFGGPFLGAIGSELGKRVIK
jgi:hypothetical protein